MGGRNQCAGKRGGAGGYTLPGCDRRVRTAMKHDRHHNRQETGRGRTAHASGSAIVHALDTTSTPASVCLSLAVGPEPAQIARPNSVRHYVAGGRENGGGIGRLIGYIVEAADQAGA